MDKWRCECTKRTYATKWTWDECVMFLKRKNIYDTFRYEFHEEETPYIVFKQSLAHMAGNLNAKYRFEILDSAAGARFRIRFAEEWFSGPCLTDRWMDEFFARKLDAIPEE